MSWKGWRRAPSLLSAWARTLGWGPGLGVITKPLALEMGLVAQWSFGGMERGSF